MLQLFINGLLCDLSGQETIPIDYALMSIDEIDKRKGARSYTFELPRTVNNEIIFGQSGEVTNFTQIPYTKHEARLIEDGIDLGIKFAELVSVGKTFQVNLYGTSVSFFELIKNRNMTQLDLSEFNHTYDFATVVASRSNDVGDGYIYPIINYGTDENVMGNIERRCQALSLFPALYLDDVLPRIFSEAGYTLDNKMLEDSDYTDNPIIIPATGLVFGNKYNAVFGFSADAQATPSFPNFGAINPINIDSITTYTGNWYSLPYNTTFNWGSISTPALGIGINEDFNCKFRFTCDIENSGSYPLPLRIYLSGDGLSYFSGAVPIAQLIVSPGTQQYVIEGVLDDTVSQWLGQTTKIFFPQGDSAITVKGGGSLEIYEADDQSIIYFNGEVNVSAFLPQMKQGEFVKNYCQMFGLLPIVNDNDKTVTLINFNQIEKNINNAVDWSDKIDLTEYPEIRFLIDEYAQNNYFNWSKDGDEQQPTGTNWNMIIRNDNLEPEKNVLTLDFASTFADNQLLNIPIPRIGIFTALEYKSEKKPRLLILHRRAPNDFADTSDFVYYFGLATETLSGADLIPLCRFIDNDFEYNLGFANSLNTYYTSLRSIVTDYKNVSCKMKLNAADINQLNFLNPVYVKMFNSYFYLNKVSGYVTGKTTPVELIKLY